MNYPLKSPDSLIKKITFTGIENWQSLLDLIENLPYGRNANRKDFTLVWSEQKGTCSSKHAFLKHIADLNKIQNVDLILRMYKMTEENTPLIGNELSKNEIQYIPEAHCYLKIDGIRKDVTTNSADFSLIADSILEEITIEPFQISEFKVEYHQAYLKNWILENEVQFSFEEIWRIREKCIANISGNH
ncbi:MAG: hypothetical protein ACI81T_001577 [Bacteroidia bacterium]|jgi:hypothetical protein